MMYKLAGEMPLPSVFLNASSIIQLHHFAKYDAIELGKECNGCYYLNASFYLYMSELMLE